MAPISPELIAGGVAAIAIITTAAYGYVTKRTASTSLDIDDDGKEDLSITFEGRSEDTLPPRQVLDVQGITDVKGIQETRAKNLREAGFTTPADLYYASDENLADVKHIGEYTVEQIREDIGGVDYVENDNSEQEVTQNGVDDPDDAQ